MLKRLFNYSQMIRGKIRSKTPPFTELYPALQITNGCNKQCEGCLRSANSYQYSLSYCDFEKYLEDLLRLGQSSLLKYQFVTGGEPTIWKSEGKDIVDVLISLFKLNLIEIISMPTNGKVFEDYNFTYDFFKRLSQDIDKKAIVGISISRYQKNLGDSGYIAMDNLIKVSKEPNMKVIPIILVTLTSDDDTHIKLKKLYPTTLQRVVPFAPLGDGENMNDVAPSLSLSGNDKSSLGSYLPFFKNEVTKKIKINSDDFDSLPNSMLIDLLSLYSHCGDSPFIDQKWHYCLPFKEDPKFTLCQIGEMREGTIDDFLNENEFLKCIRAEGILSALWEHKNELSKNALAKLDELYAPETKVPVAYRGCMVCKAMHDRGIIQELMRS